MGPSILRLRLRVSTTDRSRRDKPSRVKFWLLAKAGVDTRALQALLGHRNIQHTVRYTEFSRTRALAPACLINSVSAEAQIVCTLAGKLSSICEDLKLAGINSCWKNGPHVRICDRKRVESLNKCSGRRFQMSTPYQIFESILMFFVLKHVLINENC